MEKQGTGERNSSEVRSRAVRMVLKHVGEYSSQWAAISSIAGKIGCTAETQRRWVRQAERDEGLKPGPTSAEQVRIRELEREVRELRQANEILRKARCSWRRCCGSCAPVRPGRTAGGLR